VAAVALHQAASCFTPDGDDGEPVLRIKWPNDLISPHGAKLAGILLERAGDAVVVGFGVNLAHHPEDLGRPIADLGTLFGVSVDPASFCVMLSDVFASWLLRWRQEGLPPIRRAWLRAAHPLNTLLSTPEGEGHYDGLDESGALRLRLPSGDVRLIHAGDVFLL
jgi:BirA family biotin operon repressor/biotin-[acetyl-CoA-carboxylase] ligase